MARLDRRDARQTEQSEGEAGGCSGSTTEESGLLGTAKACSFGWVGTPGNVNIDA